MNWLVLGIIALALSGRGGMTISPPHTTEQKDRTPTTGTGGTTSTTAQDATAVAVAIIKTVDALYEALED